MKPILKSLCVVIALCFAGNTKSYSQDLSTPSQPAVELFETIPEIKPSVVDTIKPDTNEVIDPVESMSYQTAKQNFDSALASHRSHNYQAGGCDNPPNGAYQSVDAGYFNYEGFDGLVRAFKVTGDESYINDMLTMANNHIDSGRNEVSPDGYHDWYSCNNGPYNDHHYEWRAAAGIGMFLTLLLDRTDLRLSTPETRSKLGHFLRDQVWSKWQGRSAPLNHDVSNTGGATHMIARLIPVVIALEQYEGGTAPSTPNKSYANWLENIVPKALQEHIMHPQNLNPDGVSGNFWGRINPAPGDDVSGTLSPGSNDVGHAQDVFVGMLYAAERGVLSDPEGVRSRLAGAVNNVIWDGNNFNDWVNGKAPKNAKTPEGLLGILEYSPGNRDNFYNWSLSNINVTSNSFASRMQVWAYFMAAYASR